MLRTTVNRIAAGERPEIADVIETELSSLAATERQGAARHRRRPGDPPAQASPHGLNRQNESAALPADMCPVALTNQVCQWWMIAASFKATERGGLSVPPRLGRRLLRDRAPSRGCWPWRRAAWECGRRGTPAGRRCSAGLHRVGHAQRVAGVGDARVEQHAVDAQLHGDRRRRWPCRRRRRRSPGSRDRRP